MASLLYGQYMERFLYLRGAMERGGVEALRRVELELADLDGPEAWTASLAIHDVATRLPPRGEAHFVRLLRQPWGHDHVLHREALGSHARRKARPHSESPAFLADQ
ncbi:MAG: hypothetical protein HZB56_17185 [Deltaproteobacteria bacterium]|nr:hypothetical protein [Deltaproteobacteria bacterium]